MLAMPRKRKKAGRYTSVSVPTVLFDEARSLIETYSLGYTSVSELVRSLLRDWLVWVYERISSRTQEPSKAQS